PLLSWSELDPVISGTLARSATSLAISVSALAKQPWIADSLFPLISRSVSVRVTVVSLCTSEMIKLSLAPPSDLMPPASLTISTASLAAATQPTPICAMLPVVGYSAPMLTGSAAQPRKGTAPKAPATTAPVALRRNLRRLGRRDSSGLVLPWLPRTDCRRSFFISTPPVRSRRKLPFARPVRLLFAKEPSPVENCLQYSFQSYYGCAGNLPPVGRLRSVGRLLHLGNYGRKATRPGESASAQIPSDARAAGARTGRGRPHRQAHRGGHRAGATSAAGASGRAGSVRSVPDPPRRCAARAV